jgi:hypothetical protein
LKKSTTTGWDLSKGISTYYLMCDYLAGPVSNLEAIEGGNATLYCDTTTDSPGDELMLLVWYKNNAPIFR